MASLENASCSFILDRPPQPAGDPAETVIATQHVAAPEYHARTVFPEPTSLDVHLVDGTYELFRHYYAVPSALDRNGREVGAVRGVLSSILGMINGGATHVGVATDHVIESFRNQLWRGYQTGAGIEPALLAQFPVLQEALKALSRRV